MRRPAGSAVIALGAILVMQLCAACQAQSLEQGMKALQNELDKLRVSTSTLVMDGGSAPNTSTTEYSNVATVARTCSVRYHIKIDNDGRIVRDADEELDLRTLSTFDVVPEVGIAPVPALHITGGRFVPPYFHLRVWGNTNFNFNFPDAASAERVRSKFARAVKLCPEGGPRPQTENAVAVPGPDFPNVASFYPLEARRAHEGGRAIVSFCVDVNGHLTAAPSIVKSSGNTSLDTAAIDLAKAGSGHYAPAMRNGVMVPGCGKFMALFKPD